MFDNTDPRSFEAVQTWKTFLDESGTCLPVLLLGTKARFSYVAP